MSAVLALAVVTAAAVAYWPLTRRRTTRAVAVAVAMLGLVVSIGFAPVVATATVYNYDAHATAGAGARHAPDAPTIQASASRAAALIPKPGSRMAALSPLPGLQPSRRAAKGAESALSQAGKRRLAKRLGEVPRSSSPVARGGSARTGRWWEYDDVSGQRKILVEDPDGTVHVGIPKPQSTHTTGGPPKFYDYGNFGHVGE